MSTYTPTDAYNRAQYTFDNEETSNLFVQNQKKKFNKEEFDNTMFDEFIEKPEPKNVPVDTKINIFSEFIEPENVTYTASGDVKKDYTNLRFDNRTLLEKLKEGLVGDEFEYEEIWGRALGKSNIALMLEYYDANMFEIGAYDHNKAFSDESDDYTWLERALESGIGILADVPTFLAGAIPATLATSGNPFAAGFAGAFVNEAIKLSYLEALERGEVDGFSEWFEIFTEEAMYDSLKSGVQLGATLGAGKLITKTLLPTLAKIKNKSKFSARPEIRNFSGKGWKPFFRNYSAQVGMFQAAGMALHQELPSRENLVNDLILFGAFNIKGHGPKLLRQKQFKENKTTKEVIEEYQKNPLLKQAVHSRNARLEGSKITYEDVGTIKGKRLNELAGKESRLEATIEQLKIAQKEKLEYEKEVTGPREVAGRTMKSRTERMDSSLDPLHIQEARKSAFESRKDSARMEEIRPTRTQETSAFDSRKAIKGQDKAAGTKTVTAEGKIPIAELSKEGIEKGLKVTNLEKRIQTLSKEIEVLKKPEESKIEVKTERVEPDAFNVSPERQATRAMRVTERVKPKFLDKLKSAKEIAAEQLIDALHPVNKLLARIQKTGTLEAITVSEKLQLSSGMFGRAAQFITDGPIKFDNLAEFGAKSLNAILEPLVNKRVEKINPARGKSQVALTYLPKRAEKLNPNAKKPTIVYEPLPAEKAQARTAEMNDYLQSAVVAEKYKNGEIVLSNDKSIYEGNRVLILEGKRKGEAGIAFQKEAADIHGVKTVSIQFVNEEGTVSTKRYKTEQLQNLDRYFKEDIANAKKIIEDTPYEMKQIAKELYKFQNQVLDYLVDSGYLSKEARVLIERANRYYAPFNKFIEYTAQGKIKPGQAKIKEMDRWAGSKQLMQDPITSIYRNTIYYVQLAERNSTYLQFVDVLKTSPEMMKEFGVKQVKTKKQKTIELNEAEQKIFNKKEITPAEESVKGLRADGSFVGNNNLVVWRKGVKEVWEMPQDIISSLSGQNRHTLGLLKEVLRKPTKLLRSGATLAPEFFFANLMRDGLTTSIVSKVVHIPYKSLIIGASELWKNHRQRKAGLGKTDLVKEYEKSGAMMGNFLDMDFYFDTAMRKEFTARKVQNELDFTAAEKVFNFLHTVGSAGETAARLGEFKAIKETLLKERTKIQEVVPTNISGPLGEIVNAVRGGSKGKAGGGAIYSEVKRSKRPLTDREILERAGFEAKDIMDFSKQGVLGESINYFSAFFSARLRSYGKIYETVRDRPVEYFSKSVAYITVPSMLLWWVNHDDPEYQALPQWKKDLFLNIPMHKILPDYVGIEPLFFSLPRPWEPGLIFGTGVERFFDWAIDNDKEAFTNFWTDFGLATVNGNFAIPDIVKPAVELQSNFSFFTRGPIVSNKEQKFLPEFQVRESTSEIGKFIGRHITPLLGIGTTSPVSIDYFIRAWTGTLGRHALNITSALVRGADTDRRILDAWSTENYGFTSKNINNIPILKAFFIRNPSLSSSHISRFYETFMSTKEIVDTMNEIKFKTDSYSQEKYEELLSSPEFIMHKALADTSKVISELRFVLDLITDDKEMDGNEKRDNIDELTRMIVEIAQQGNEIAKGLKEE